MMKRIDLTGHRTRIGATVVSSIALLLLAWPVISGAATQSSRNRAFVQEGLGAAIVSSATAETAQERGRAQEVLGVLISQAALENLEPVRIENNPAIGAHEGWRETRGEPVVWIFAALGGTAMLFGAFFGLRNETIPPAPKPAT